MTIISFDGTSVAADRRVTWNGIGRSVTKIQWFGESILALTGGWDLALELCEWFKAGAKPADFTTEMRAGTAGLIVFTRTTIDAYDSGPYPMRLELPRAAFGSGRDFAEAAMHLGQNARQAVELACHFQNDCGDGINVLTFDDRPVAPARRQKRKTP